MTETHDPSLETRVERTTKAARRKERLRRAREVIRLEARTIARLEGSLGDDFDRAVDLVLGCPGMVVVTGMGKAGKIGDKIAATFASTGTPAIHLHPAEALHGDLGRIRASDLVLALSNSGETAELRALLAGSKKIGARVVGMTARADSTLGRLSDCVLELGTIDEACPLGLAPTASTAAMLALGDALAMVVSGERGFSREEYALYHPAGSLGRKLMRVGEVMRQGDALPLVEADAGIGRAVDRMTSTRGRPGAVLIVGADGRLLGIFTDGGLRRLFHEGQLVDRDRPVAEVMTTSPKVVTPDRLVQEAERMLREHRIDQVPVVDAEGRPVGLLDIQDLLDVRS